jgi:hypothetical protein
MRNVSYMRPSLLNQVSSAGTNSDRVSAVVKHDAEDAVSEVRDSKAYGGVSSGVAGILYKWVNYGKGQRSRWFVLEDGLDLPEKSTLFLNSVMDQRSSRSNPGSEMPRNESLRAEMTIRWWWGDRDDRGIWIMEWR